MGRRRDPAAAAGRGGAGSRAGTARSRATPRRRRCRPPGRAEAAASLVEPDRPVGEEDVLPGVRLRPRLTGSGHGRRDVVERVRLAARRRRRASGCSWPGLSPKLPRRPAARVVRARRPPRRPCGRTGTEPAQTRGRRNGTIGFEGGGTAPHPGRGWRRRRSTSARAAAGAPVGAGRAASAGRSAQSAPTGGVAAEASATATSSTVRRSGTSLTHTAAITHTTSVTTTASPNAGFSAAPGRRASRAAGGSPPRRRAWRLPAARR